MQRDAVHAGKLVTPVLLFQAADEPAYLTVGTDVSAKYRGAFCEAKIKTVKRLVKVKVRASEEPAAPAAPGGRRSTLVPESSLALLTSPGEL